MMTVSKKSRWTSFLLAALALPATLTIDVAEGKQRVLLYSRTAGFRHDSIPDAVDAFEKLGKEHDIHMFNSETESHFEDEDWVNNWDAIVFVSVSGQALTNAGAVNMMKYIENGGGFMGIHEACDAMYKSPWYGRLLGAYFNYHPYIQRFDVKVDDHDHPSTSFLGDTWSVYDEVYTFNSNPRKLGKQVVLTADPSTYKDPTGPGLSELRAIEGAHPIAWYKEGDLLTEPKSNPGGGVMDTKSTPKNQRGTGGDGRAFYTALGHTKSCWSDDDMIKHVWGGLRWVLDSPTIRSNNQTLPASAPGTKFIATTDADDADADDDSDGDDANSSFNTTASGQPLSKGVKTATLSGSSQSSVHCSSYVMVMLAALFASSVFFLAAV